MFYYVYILESLKDKSWYIGFTTNIKKRVLQHNKKESKATKPKSPYRVIYCEAYLNKKDAMGRERFLKSGAGRMFLKKQLNNYINKRRE